MRGILVPRLGIFPDRGSDTFWSSVKGRAAVCRLSRSFRLTGQAGPSAARANRCLQIESLAFITSASVGWARLVRACLGAWNRDDPSERSTKNAQNEDQERGQEA